jgi:hypothetical protein
MLLVRIALVLAAFAASLATFLGQVAEKSPGGEVAARATCVHKTAGHVNLQVGYCP